VEGISTTGCCLVPRGDRSRHWLFTTPVPCNPRHDASHLGLGSLDLLKIKPLRASGPVVLVRGDSGIPDGRWECDFYQTRSFDQGKLRDCEALGVI
jgi:hypothetical protein